jgi:hypothetical protein
VHVLFSTRACTSVRERARSETGSNRGKDQTPGATYRGKYLNHLDSCRPKSRVLKAVGMATAQQPQEPGLDHRGERRLSPKESAIWYTVAAVTYIAIGTWQKVLLTWFIGPMWVVATLTFGPRSYDRLRGRSNEANSVGQPGSSTQAIPASPARLTKDTTL